MEMVTKYMIEYGLTEDEAIEAVQKDEVFDRDVYETYNIGDYYSEVIGG